MADGYRCTTTTAAYGQQLAIAESSPINVGNWFMSLLAFEESGDRVIFSDEAGAKTYDAARLWVTQTGVASSDVDGTSGLALIPASDDTPADLATADSPGWAIYYDHEGITTIDTHRFTISWKDERTSSASATGEGLITWNTTQPTLAEVVSTSASCKVSRCTAESRRVAYHYAANPETGAPYLGFTQDGAVVRAIKSYLLVPTQADQTTVFVNQKGQVAVGLTAVNPEKGATNVGMGEPVDPTSDLGYVEVSEELHACRHQDPPVCK
jgi:type IV pilus assembly protein PilY1